MESHRCTRSGLVLFVLLVFAGAWHTEQDSSDGIDPDCYRNVSSLIANKGYQVEEYEVTTSDGYILAVQRIPGGRSNALRIQDAPKKVVFLLHGLLGSSADWVLNYPPQSLGFILADAGYDVWLGNVRGNTYSSHAKYNRRSKEFWNFSVDEMIERDLPETLDFVLKRTGREKVFFVGHSQGTAIMFGLLAMRPEYSEKIELFCALGPVSAITNTRSPMRYMSPFGKYIGAFVNFLGKYEFLPNNFVMKLLADAVCMYEGPRDVCGNIVFLICGPETRELNVTRLPVFLCHVPAGTSVRAMVHYSQILISGRFQKFDFGENRNQLIYGTSTPPEYDVSRVVVPVALFWSEGDWMADPRDVALLRRRLPNVVLDFKVSQPKFSHIDFAAGIHAKALVYEPMMKLMASYKSAGE
uniref:Lipase n=1 Tax=Ixodes ricinus TaxID=34613 RepID=A0A6B0VCD9_IXORI